MIPPEMVKRHLRLDSDFCTDDDLLVFYIRVAAAHVEQTTRRKLYASEDSQGYTDDPDHLLLNDDVKAAMLLLVAFWYENRLPVSPGEVTEMPYAVEALLQPYRIYGL